jgi:hypothetical protein
MRRHDPTARPDFLDPKRVRTCEQVWFSDFHGWNLVVESDTSGGEPPYIISVLSYGQYGEWELLRFDVMPKWFFEAIQEAVDYAWAYGYEEADDYIANRANLEYGDRYESV